MLPVPDPTGCVGRAIVRVGPVRAKLPLLGTRKLHHNIRTTISGAGRDLEVRRLIRPDMRAGTTDCA